MRLRDFITFLGIAAAGWLLATPARQGEPMRAVNLKTAKALGLSVPQSLLARADEVIE